MEWLYTQEELREKLPPNKAPDNRINVEGNLKKLEELREDLNNILGAWSNFCSAVDTVMTYMEQVYELEVSKTKR